MQDLCDHYTSTVSQADPLDTTVDFILAARERTGPVERIDRPPRRGYRQRYARSEVIHGESFSRSLKLEQYPPLRERQVQVRRLPLIRGKKASRRLPACWRI